MTLSNERKMNSVPPDMTCSKELQKKKKKKEKKKKKRKNENVGQNYLKKHLNSSIVIEVSEPFFLF